MASEEPEPSMPYARVRPPATLTARRLGVWIVLVLLCVCASLVANRIRVLNSNPSIGPIDWSAVARSATLQNLALRLMFDARIALPSVEPPVKPAAASPLLGSRADSVTVRLVMPLQYDEQSESVRVTLEIANVGSASIVVPPASVTYSHNWMVSAAEWQCYFLPSNAPQASRDPIGTIVAFGPVLGKGVEVLAPGVTTRRQLAFRAPATPLPLSLKVAMYGCYEEFLIDLKPRYGGYGDAPRAWEDVPAECVKAALFAPNVPWPPPNWGTHAQP